MYDTEVLAAVLALGGVVVIASLVWYVLLVVAAWKVFTKAGEPGWKAIIPIYNTYILYKISWKKSMFWLMLAFALLGSIFSAIDNTAMAIIGWLLTVAGGVISIIQSYKLSKAFGHGVGFTIGLIFLSPIFMLILGFGESKYVGNGEN